MLVLWHYDLPSAIVKYCCLKPAAIFSPPGLSDSTPRHKRPFQSPLKGKKKALLFSDPVPLIETHCTYQWIKRTLKVCFSRIGFNLLNGKGWYEPSCYPGKNRTAAYLLFFLDIYWILRYWFCACMHKVLLIGCLHEPHSKNTFSSSTSPHLHLVKMSVSR